MPYKYIKIYVSLVCLQSIFTDTQIQIFSFIKQTRGKNFFKLISSAWFKTWVIKKES